jgi:hypothetical protein
MLRPVAARCALTLLLILAGSLGAPAAELTFDIRIEHSSVPEATRLMRVHGDDVVTLRWTSDRPLVLHLHGYDIEKHVAANGVTEMKFTAYATGRFPIEIHGKAAGGAAHDGAPLAIIEVYPR